LGTQIQNQQSSSQSLQMSVLNSDPILQMFDQSFQFKDMCFDLINQQSSMEDLKAEFLEFYTKSIDQLDHFFSASLKIKEAPLPLNTLKKPVLCKPFCQLLLIY